MRLCEWWWVSIWLYMYARRHWSYKEVNVHRSNSNTQTHPARRQQASRMSNNPCHTRPRKSRSPLLRLPRRMGLRAPTESTSQSFSCLRLRAPADSASQCFPRVLCLCSFFASNMVILKTTTPCHHSSHQPITLEVAQREDGAHHSMAAGARAHRRLGGQGNWVLARSFPSVYSCSPFAAPQNWSQYRALSDSSPQILVNRMS